jgi:hypothetical protein
MNIIISQIDAEIARLREARKALVQASEIVTTKRPVGRPKSASKIIKTVAREKRVMSAEGKARIAAAQKKRWAKSKRLAKKAAALAA